jgi:hypothetical protein
MIQQLVAGKLIQKGDPLLPNSEKNVLISIMIQEIIPGFNIYNIYNNNVAFDFT